MKLNDTDHHVSLDDVFSKSEYVRLPHIIELLKLCIKQRDGANYVLSALKKNPEYAKLSRINEVFALLKEERQDVSNILDMPEYQHLMNTYKGIEYPVHRDSKNNSLSIPPVKKNRVEYNRFSKETKQFRFWKEYSFMEKCLEKAKSVFIDQ